MKVGELIEKLSKFDADTEVCVKVTNCISAYVAEPVKDVSHGFDWTAGKAILSTETELHRLKPPCKRCDLCQSKVGERVGIQLHRDFLDASKPITICVTLDGKRKAMVKVDEPQYGVEGVKK